MVRIRFRDSLRVSVRGKGWHSFTVLCGLGLCMLSFSNRVMFMLLVWVLGSCRVTFLM